MGIFIFIYWSQNFRRNKRLKEMKTKVSTKNKHGFLCYQVLRSLALRRDFL
jgi:hypothetical protein